MNIPIKNILQAIFIASLTCLALSGCSGSDKQRIKFATGPQGGSWYPLGGAIKNLAEKQPEEAGRLHKLLAAWRKKVGAKLPTKNPDFRAAKKP